MSKQFKNFLIKILALSTLIVLGFNIGDNLINANKVAEKQMTNTQNESNFKKVNSSSLGKTGVAISTNIGIRYKQRTETPATIYKDIFSVSEVIDNTNTANKELIGANMQAVEEYKNVLKTDVKQLIDSSYDKSRILDAFIEQLEFRYVLGAQNAKKLLEQKTTFETEMNNINTKIENLKTKIDSDFKNNNDTETLENIDTYLELKKQYYYARTYIIYINHFVSEYAYLNNYNKKLLDTLINNKDAIVKDAYIVIPDSGSEMLKEFNLIYSEEEYKK